MDELIGRVLNGDAGPEEEDQVRRWRAESQENEARFAELRDLWALTAPRVRAHHDAPPDPAVILRAAEERRRLERAPSHVHPLGGKGRAVRRPSWRTWGLALAASVAAVALGIRFFGSSQPGSAPGIAFDAPPSAPRTVALDDGSLVRLAPGARITVSEGEGERGVELEGRAFFAVAHEEERPFVVRTRVAEAQVLGTRFEISVTDETVRAVVVEGRVAVSNDLGRAVVPAGSVGRAGIDAAPTAEPSDDVFALLDWPGGVLLFQSTPLEQVAREVGRRFGRTVDVVGSQLGALRISASFEDETFEEVVHALCDVAGATCTLTATGATISPTGGPPAG